MGKKQKPQPQSFGQRLKAREMQKPITGVELAVLQVAGKIIAEQLAEKDRRHPETEDIKKPAFRDMLFEVKPVPLDEMHQLLLNFTEHGKDLDPEHRRFLLEHGDSAQVEFAVVEGLRKGWDKTRQELFRPSGERI